MRLLALAALALVGCAAEPDRFYSLGSSAVPTMVPLQNPPLQIELPPVAVPERLVRPQLVLRSANGEVHILDNRRWSASFDNELRDALATSIAARLGAIDISGGGRLAGQPVLRIAVQLRQWEAVENTRVDASFSWTIRRSDDARNLACQWSQTQPVGTGLEALTQGMQQLAAAVAERMAASVAALQADAAAQCPV